MTMNMRMQSNAKLAACQALLGLALLLAGCPRSSPNSSATVQKPPEIIVLILIDTLRADYVGAYGHAPSVTPALDGLARDGVVFEHVNSPAPWTLPAMASLFCGVYPDVHQCDDYGNATGGANGGMQVRTLDERFITLAEALQAGGYETAGFVANPFLTQQNGFGQGFDHYDTSFANNMTSGSIVNGYVLDWLGKRQSKRPLFLYVHYMDVHGPYRAAGDRLDPLLKRVEQLADKHEIPASERERHQNFFSKGMAEYADEPRHQKLANYVEYWQARYSAGVAECDAHVGALRAGLQQLGLFDKSLLIVTADHGEALGEHGFWSHGFSAHQDQLHVPLIVRWPAQIAPGSRIAPDARLFDLLPTVLTWAAAPLPPNIQAQSLTPLFVGPEKSPRTTIGEAVKERPAQRALLADGWKLLADAQAKKYELYHLTQDPTERTDLAAGEAKRVETMRAQLDHLVAANLRHPLFSRAKLTELTSAEVKRLQALGYLGDDDEPAPATTSAPATQP